MAVLCYWMTQWYSNLRHISYRAIFPSEIKWRLNIVDTYTDENIHQLTMHFIQLKRVYLITISIRFSSMYNWEQMSIHFCDGALPNIHQAITRKHYDTHESPSLTVSSAGPDIRLLAALSWWDIGPSNIHNLPYKGWKGYILWHIYGTIYYLVTRNALLSRHHIIHPD